MNTRPIALPRPVRLLLALAATASAALAGENLAKNPGVEAGAEDWRVFMAKESEDKGAGVSADATVYHSGKYSLRMFSPVEARYSVSPSVKFPSVKAGARYRFSIWVKAGDDFAQKPGTPGFHVRATMFEAPGKDIAGGHYHFGFQGRALRGAPLALLGSSPVPREWTELTAVFVVPPGVQRMNFNLFVERASGSLYLDDLMVSAVGEDTPLTPLLGEAK